MGAFSKNNIGLTFDYVDFAGPCATCRTDCIDEWERMFEKKFAGTGFMVDGTDPDPDGGFPNQIIFGKDWPQYSLKGQSYDTASDQYVTIPLASEVKIGDIRVAYTDHWVVTTGKSGGDETRTFMKRPEEYWAEKAIPMPPQGTMTDDEYQAKVFEINELRRDWIRCRHTHTDHVHDKRLSGGGTSSSSFYPITIDDCVTGIWDYNLVDTCTTIETYGIYETVHLYEVFPACGSLSKKSEPKSNVTEPLIHVVNYQPEPSSIHDHSSCGSDVHRELYDPGDWFHFMGSEPGHGQPCACPPAARGQYGKTVMAITSPWCDHTLSGHSKHPHRLGIGHEDGKPQAHLYDNEGQGKVFGAICETFMFKVGEFYKTTVRHFGTTLQPFQAPSGASKIMFTFLHPETGGQGPQSHPAQGAGDGGFWCTSDGVGAQGNVWRKKHGAKMLLQLPCNYPIYCPATFADGAIDGDGVQCCEDWDTSYCDEQLEHIFFNEVDLLAAFDRDPRYKSADLHRNGSLSRIHKQSATAITCENSQVYGWVWLMKPCEGFGQDKWGRMGGFPASPTANCNPSGPRCDCGDFPGSPPNTRFAANVGLTNKVQTSWQSGHAKILSTLWGVDGVDLGNSCSWSQTSVDSFSHCGKGDAFLVRVDFFEGEFYGNSIKFERSKKAVLHPPSTVPKEHSSGVDTPWSKGGMHTDLRTSVAAWTNFDSRKDEQSNTSYNQTGKRFETDFEAAEVFYKAAGSIYWYDILARGGKSLPFIGELEYDPALVEHLATDKMVDDPIGQDKRKQDQDGESPCNTPERSKETAITSTELAVIGPFVSCALNDPVLGCNDVRTKIFTGVGDPAPRFDQGKRINNANNQLECGGRCTHSVDEVFNLSKKLKSCIGGVSIDNCTNLYFVHKPYIKLKAEFSDACHSSQHGFFACGIPVGKVDRSIIGTKGGGDNEHCFCRDKDDGSIIQALFDFNFGQPQRSQQEICEDAVADGGFGGTWECKDFGAPVVSICDSTWLDLGEVYADDNTYCGLAQALTGSDAMYGSVSCTSCETYECSPAAEVFSPNANVDPFANTYTCEDGVHCCHWLVDNPLYDPIGAAMVPPQIIMGFHPDIPNSSCISSDTYCVVSSYLGGMPHPPYQSGYIWHTVLGWHPDTATQRGVFDYRYSCDDGKVIKLGNEDNHVFDCCDNKQGGEYVECNILTVPKAYERPKDIEIGEPPIPVVSLL